MLKPNARLGNGYNAVAEALRTFIRERIDWSQVTTRSRKGKRPDVSWAWFAKFAWQNWPRDTVVRFAQ